MARKWLNWDVSVVMLIISALEDRKVFNISSVLIRVKISGPLIDRPCAISHFSLFSSNDDDDRKQTLALISIYWIRFVIMKCKRDCCDGRRVRCFLNYWRLSQNAKNCMIEKRERFKIINCHISNTIAHDIAYNHNFTVSSFLNSLIPFKNLSAYLPTPHLSNNKNSCLSSNIFFAFHFEMREIQIMIILRIYQLIVSRIRVNEVQTHVNVHLKKKEMKQNEDKQQHF